MNDTASTTNKTAAWIRAIKASNPFTSTRVTEADDTSADVPEIHSKEFRTLIRRVESVRTGKHTVGIKLSGSAGSGKSHLLARFSRWCRGEGQANSVYLHNVLAAPDRLPRYLLKATVSTLAGRHPKEFANSQLYELINRAVSAAMGDVKGFPSIEERVDVLHRVGTEIDPNNEVIPVFVTLLRHAVAGDHGDSSADAVATAAVQWLSGDTIGDDVAAKIGLRADTEDGAAIPDDDGVLRTLDVIARLCGKAQRPFVLVIDQFDNLDEDRVSALSAFLHAMTDNSSNMAVVISGITESMLRFREDGIIADAAWDRLARFQIELSRISPEEGQAIIKARVAQFNAPFCEDPELMRLIDAEPMLPMTTSWLADRFKDIVEVRARDTIDWAFRRWEQEQDAIGDNGNAAWLDGVRKAARVKPNKGRKKAVDEAAIIDALVQKKLQQAKTARLLKPESLPPDADNLAALTLQLLQHCVGREPYSLRQVDRITSRRRSPLPTYDMTALEVATNGSLATNGLKFFASGSKNSATNCLRRIQSDDQPLTHRLLVTDEERRPLPLGTRGKELYDKMVKSEQLKHIKLSFDDYAALDAISVVLGTARVGDLEVAVPGQPMRPLSEQECLESLHRQNVFLKHPLLRELLTEEVAQDGENYNDDVVDPQSVRQRIVAELQWRLGMTGQEMAMIVMEREGISTDSRDAVHLVVREQAMALYEDGHLFANAQDDDLFLRLRKQPAE